MPQPMSDRAPQRTSTDPLLNWSGPSAMLWGPMITSWQAWNGTLVSSLSAVNREWLAFVTRRLQQDVALPPALAACRSTEDMWRVTAGFCQQAMEDYQREFTELARLSSHAANEGIRAMQLSADEAEDELAGAPRRPH